MRKGPSCRYVYISDMFMTHQQTYITHPRTLITHQHTHIPDQHTHIPHPRTHIPHQHIHTYICYMLRYMTCSDNTSTNTYTTSTNTHTTSTNTYALHDMFIWVARCSVLQSVRRALLRICINDMCIYACLGSWYVYIGCALQCVAVSAQGSVADLVADVKMWCMLHGCFTVWQ